VTVARLVSSAPRRRQFALGFSIILHALALGCIFLLHVQAPRLAPEPPPLEVVMITPPEPPPEPVRPPVPQAAPPRAVAPPVARPLAPPPVAVPPQPAPVSPPPVAVAPAPAPATAASVPTPQALAPTLDAAPRPAAPSGAAPPVAAAAPAARPAAVVPPSFDADYLHNPTPRYPPAAARLRETGRVLLSVSVSAAGLPERVEIAATSGSPRLDQAALETVKRWRFVPARQGDKPVAASVTVPLVFRLDE
jgi:protein TonB